MHRYNGSVLQKWANNAERELYLNGNNDDLNDSNAFDFNEDQMKSIVEENFNEQRRQGKSGNVQNDEETEDSEAEAEATQTMGLENEGSGNGEQDINDGFKNVGPKINFEVNDAIGIDIKSKRGCTNRYDLNTSLTTILSRENKHKTDASQILLMDVSNTSSMLSSLSGSEDLGLKSSSTKKRKLRSNSSNGNCSSDLANKVVFISIIASLSFSAGYALGQSRKH